MKRWKTGDEFVTYAKSIRTAELAPGRSKSQKLDQEIFASLIKRKSNHQWNIRGGRNWAEVVKRGSSRKRGAGRNFENHIAQKKKTI